MKYLAPIVGFFILASSLFLSFGTKSHEIKFDRLDLANLAASSSTATGSEVTTSSVKNNSYRDTQNSDIENQMPLNNPPDNIRGIYITGYSAGSKTKVKYILDLLKNTELNAVVVDIKDYSGHILYDIQNENVTRYNAKEIQIPKVNQLIKELHDAGVYVIARQTVFQDPALAKARPDLALKNKTTGATWLDSKKLAWMDPASKEVWDYNIAIAKDALARGFDEINFDYVRFASDGTLGQIQFPFYTETTSKASVIKNFFQYLRNNLGEAKLSADLFGLATINNDDLGIGQVLQNAALYFDYVAPMTYPSHYASGFIGYKNPAAYPYEVIKYSMEKAVAKLLPKPQKTTTSTIVMDASGATSTVFTSSTDSVPPVVYRAKLRPWFQDFSLGAVYDAAKVRAQITAFDETVKNTKLYNGWMLWNASNNYTRGALQP